jgi:hypothetical protein
MLNKLGKNTGNDSVENWKDLTRKPLSERARGLNSKQFKKEQEPPHFPPRFPN